MCLCLERERVLTNKETNNVGRDLVLAGHRGGDSARPAAAVPGPDVADHDPAIHRRETEILEAAAFLEFMVEWWNMAFKWNYEKS